MAKDRTAAAAESTGTGTSAGTGGGTGGGAAESEEVTLRQQVENLAREVRGLVSEVRWLKDKLSTLSQATQQALGVAAPGPEEPYPIDVFDQVMSPPANMREGTTQEAANRTHDATGAVPGDGPPRSA